MVFAASAQFEQFVHCKFRESVVRALLVPFEGKQAFLIVNKYGKVGLYDPEERLTLIHAYLLDLSGDLRLRSQGSRSTSTQDVTLDLSLSKCRQTHFVVDAAFAPDLSLVFYLTNRGQIIGYDIGDIEHQRFGVEVLPGKRFQCLRSGQCPTEVKNRGHVETHRVHGLPPFSTCLEYHYDRGEGSGRFQSLLLIGSPEGLVTIIVLTEKEKVFGFRKVRSVVHQIHVQDLADMGVVSAYETFQGPISDVLLLAERKAIVTSSKDSGCSLTFRDLRHILEPRTISIPTGVNVLAHCESLQILATGSDDAVVRLFNDLVPSEPIAELEGHARPIKSLEFLSAPFVHPNPILLSFAENVELRVWDITTYACLQTLYVSFPLKSAISCKTPEFSRRAIYVYDHQEMAGNSKSSKSDFVLLFYCNSFAKLKIEKNDSYWPFDFEALADEFLEISTRVQKKLKINSKRKSRSFEISKNPRKQLLTFQEMAEVEARLDSYANEVLRLKAQVDASFETNNLGTFQANNLETFQANNFPGTRNKTDIQNTYEANIEDFEANFKKFQINNKTESFEKNIKKLQTNPETKMQNLEANADFEAKIVNVAKFEAKRDVSKKHNVSIDANNEAKRNESVHDAKEYVDEARINDASNEAQFNTSLDDMNDPRREGSKVNDLCLSSRVSRAAFALRRDKLRFLQEGGAFKSLPTMALDPMTFVSEDPPITNVMADAGLSRVTSPSDLLTPAARNCFSFDNMTQIREAGSLTWVHYRQTLGSRVSSSEGSSRSVGSIRKNSTASRQHSDSSATRAIDGSGSDDI